MTKSKSNGSIIPTKHDFEEYRNSKAKLLRAFAEKAKLDQTRETLLQMAQTAEDAEKPDVDTEQIGQDVADDENIFKLLMILHEGPNWKQKLLWKVSPTLSFCRSTVCSLFDIMLKFGGIMLQIFGYAAVSLGAIYFAIYSFGYGLGVQGVLGLIAFVILNAILYGKGHGVFNSYYDNPKTEEERKRVLFWTSFISTVFIVLFTLVVSITPSVNGSDSEWTKENVGIVYDRQTGKVVELVYPSGSKFQPESEKTNGGVFMDAPIFWKHNVSWFSFAKWRFEKACLKVKDGKTVAVSFTVDLLPKVKVGDELNGKPKSEQEYIKEIDGRMAEIILNSYKDGVFDPVTCKQKIESMFNNEIFSGHLASEGFAVTETFATVNLNFPAIEIDPGKAMRKANGN